MGYTEIDVPQGSYVGWGNKPGQVIEGVVTDYDPTGATGFGGKGECPALEIELSRTAHSYSKKTGQWTTYEAGETVQLSCGQVQLKKKVRKAQPRIGDSIRIELTDLIAVDNGTVKSFTVGIDRNAGNGQRSGSSVQAPAEDSWANTPPPSAPADSDDPPF
jgi:hypothetical protein